MFHQFSIYKLSVVSSTVLPKEEKGMVLIDHEPNSNSSKVKCNYCAHDHHQKFHARDHQGDSQNHASTKTLSDVLIPFDELMPDPKEEVHLKS